MIGFDNGPRGGDYVRYIDDLVRQAAVNVIAAKDVELIDGKRERPSTAAPTTGFVVPTEAGKAAAAAAAIASALMSGEMSKRAALSAHQQVGFAALAVGIVFVVAGLLWQPLNVLVLVVGGAIISWAVRMMRGAAARLDGSRSNP